MLTGHPLSTVTLTWDTSSECNVKKVIMKFTHWGRLETHFCQWMSPRSSLGCGGSRTSHLRSTSVCWRYSARRLSTSSEWSLIWNGEGTKTHSWCCTVPLFVPRLTIIALCMAQHQTPTYDNWTVFITLDWDWHWEHSAPAQCPTCTQRPTKFFWRNVGYSCPCIIMWKLVPALTIQHIMPCLNSNEPLGIYMFPGQMEEQAWPRPHHLSQSRGSQDLCRDQCRIDLPPEDTQLSTRNAWLWTQETQPH